MLSESMKNWRIVAIAAIAFGVAEMSSMAFLANSPSLLLLNGVSVSSLVAYQAFSFAVSLLFVGCGRAVGSLRGKFSVLALLMLCCLSGVACSFGAADGAVFLLGIAFYALGYFTMLFLWMEVVGSLPPLAMMRTLALAAAGTVAGSALLEAIPSSELVPWALFALGSLAVIYLDREVSASEGPQGAVSFNGVALAKTLLGLAIVSTAVACTQQIALAHEDVSSAFPLGTGAASAIIFAFVLFRSKDIDLVLVVKIIATMVTVALLLLLYNASFTALSYSFAGIAYGLFNYLGLFVALLLGQALPGKRLRIYGVMEAIMGVGVLAVVVSTFCDVPLSSTQATVTLVALLTLAGFWLLGDRWVDGLFGEMAPKAKGEEASFEGRARLIAARFGLTPREEDVLMLFSVGRSAPFIAEALFISENTVKSHLQRIYVKCGVHSRQELITLIDSAMR